MIRPILEYANVIYDGSADTHTQRVESTQRQAALACTGAYKHTHHVKLLEELGWPLLETRRKHQRLNIMFKIQNGLTPPYLRGICPPLTRNRTDYYLRTGANITTPAQRTTTYHMSFIPHTIRDWNNLDILSKSSTSIECFKYKLKKSLGSNPNPLFFHNNSKAAINQSRIRMGLSALSSQRFDYRHIDNPKCLTCNARTEDPAHYFLLCPTYDTVRPDFLDGITDILRKSNIIIDFTKRHFRVFMIRTILNGSTILSDNENKEVMKLTQQYIRDSKRFP
jgi:hypothetical protein